MEVETRRGAGIYTLYTLTTAHRRELRASFGFTAVAAAGRPACRVALRAGAALHLSLARSRTALRASSPRCSLRRLPCLLAFFLLKATS